MTIPLVVGQPVRPGPPPPSARLVPLDALRGLAMVLMALDHVRDYFTNIRFDPTDLTQTTLEVFLTRWVTHFCAPVFVALTGTAAFLAGQRRGPAELSRFLWTRGLWLVVLEFTVVRFGWMFNLDYSLLFVQVIWAIGWSLVALAGLVRLPLRAIALVGAVLVLGHNLLDGVSPAAFGAFGWLWHLLHVPGPAQFPGGLTVFVAYPLIPWIGVMALGYAAGPVMQWEGERRRKALVLGGLAMTVAFLALRAANGYGDPVRWGAQYSSDITAVSFLNLTKYPPSLLFLLMTLGPALLVLALFETLPPGLLSPLVTFGRVPLFYYVLHLYVAHALAVVAAFVTLGRAGFLFSNMEGFLSPPAEWGFRLRWVYVWWLVVVALCYPVCRWFARVKQERRDLAWLSYL